MQQVVTIGSLPDEFSTYLEAAGYLDKHETFSAVSVDDEELPAAVAVYSRDVQLEFMDTILGLLRRNVVLLLFSPSTDLCGLLKSSTGTVLDLPEIKLDEGFLIVYKFLDLDHFHFIPVCTPNNDTNLLQHSVKLIGDCLSHLSDLKAKRVLSAATFADTLKPPTGTSFVSSTSVTIGERSSDSWRFDTLIYLYTYATNYTPRPNSGFRPNGGVVYTVIRFGGNFNHNDRSLGPLRYCRIYGDSSSHELQNYLQTPERGTQQRNIWHYQMDMYKQLNLFKNNGATPFEYTISYSNTFTVDGVSQTITARPNNVVEVGLNGITWGMTRLPLYGLCMWESDVGRNQLRFDFEFDSTGGRIIRRCTTPLDLTFGG